MHVRAQNHASVYVRVCVRLGLHMFLMYTSVFVRVRAFANPYVMDVFACRYLLAHVCAASF